MAVGSRINAGRDRPNFALFPRALGQFKQLEVASSSLPVAPLAVSMSWLSTAATLGSGRWVGYATSFGKSFLIAASAFAGRCWAMSATLFPKRRPKRSYQGPVPTRSMAFTVFPVASSDALRKARQPFAPAPGMLASAKVLANLVGAAQARACAGLSVAQVSTKAGAVVG